MLVESPKLRGLTTFERFDDGWRYRFERRI
jgi:hypothetical protein